MGNNGQDGSADYADAYAMDLVGNRLTKTHDPATGSTDTTTYQYNLKDQLEHEISSLSGQTDYGYDTNGSRTSRTKGGQTDTYSYDLRSSMTGATIGGVAGTYAYDDAGMRVQRTTGGATTLYLTDRNSPTGHPEAIEEKASKAATPTVAYMFGHAGLGQSNAAGVRYFGTDGPAPPACC